MIPGTAKKYLFPKVRNHTHIYIDIYICGSYHFPLKQPVVALPVEIHLAYL